MKIEDKMKKWLKKLPANEPLQISAEELAKKLKIQRKETVKEWLRLLDATGEINWNTEAKKKPTVTRIMCKRCGGETELIHKCKVCHNLEIK